MDPTDEQKAIISYVRAGQGHLVVDALAGTGKTFALMKSIEIIPQPSILLAAFGKDIAVELESRVPKLPKTHAIHVKTFHALGRGIIMKHYPKARFDRSGTEELVNQVAGSISFNMRRAAVKLTRLTKELIAQPTPPASDVVLALGYEHNVFTSKMGEREIGLTVELVRDAYIVSLKLAKRECLDFCDMVWAPVALDLAPPSRYLAIVVDELQDISAPQMQLLQRLMIPDKSRFIGAGDIAQDLYKWRGSLGAAAWSMLREMGAKFLPLTMTWRCPKAVVEAANEIVPELRAAPSAGDGSVSECRLSDLPLKLANSRQDEIHTFVLSRNNADLVDVALYLWTQRVAFQLNTGKELLAPIFDLLSNKLNTRDEEAFRATLDEWYATEYAKAENSNATAYAETLTEQRTLLLSTLKYAKPREIAKLLGEILVPNQSGILLSTVHKVKGREADRVFLLKQTFGRYKTREITLRDWNGESDYHTEIGAQRTSTTIVLPANPSEEELNIEYVAITRAREHLIYVDIESARVPVENTFVLSDPLEDFTHEELVERLQRVENMATRTQNAELADAFMKHARAIEEVLGVRHR